MNLGGRLRGLLRALRIGERRWIPPAERRAAHAELVRHRLQQFGEKDASGGSTVDPREPE